MIKDKLLLLTLSLVMFGCSKTDEIILIDNGETDYEIRIIENADKTIKKAAIELQKYLKEIASVEVPIVNQHTKSKSKKGILIYETDGFKSEHTILIMVDLKKNIVITGGNAKSTLYAVYEFLENELGCLWLTPNVEKIPSLQKIVVSDPLHYTNTPEITTRTMHSKLFYDNPAFADKHKVTYEVFPNYVPTARVHTFHRFVPEKTFYDEHPEYYALRGNRRLPTQICLTNSDVLQIVKDSVKSYFEQYPESSVISVSTNDNTQYCTCENCKRVDEEEGSHSGSLIRFVNEVAKDFPDKQISTLAYQYTRKPSKTKPLDNVLITLCSIECDRSASINEKCTDFADDLKGWKALSENIRIWDYTTQFTNFLAPFPNIHTLQPNIQFFRDNNAKWIFEQHSHNPSELFELRSYLTAKLLWNPDANAEEIITEFVNAYYEEGGVFVKKYIDAIHAEIQNNPDFFLFLYGDPAQGFDSFLSAENLKRYNTFFDEAEKAIAHKPEILRRVQVARISTDYASLGMARSGKSKDFHLLENGQVSTGNQKRLQRFETSCQAANITLMNEMGYTVEEFLALYEKTMERASIKNIAAGKSVKLLTKPKKYANENPQALTDAALGGSNFYANWLGFEGNNMEAVIDLGEELEFNSMSTGFLQVTNHIVFFPESVTFSVSKDGEKFEDIETVATQKQLTKESKRNDIEYFTANFETTNARYLKIRANNIGKAPVWHNSAGLPAWIFIDEVIVN